MKSKIKNKTFKNLQKLNNSKHLKTEIDKMKKELSLEKLKDEYFELYLMTQNSDKKE